MERTNGSHLKAYALSINLNNSSALNRNVTIGTCTFGSCLKPNNHAFIYHCHYYSVLLATYLTTISKTSKLRATSESVR